MSLYTSRHALVSARLLPLHIAALVAARDIFCTATLNNHSSPRHMQSQEFLEIGRHCKEPSCNVSPPLSTHTHLSSSADWIRLSF